MVETATGLVLRTRPLTETSLIIHWITPGLGRIATVAKGARRPKSSFFGKLDLLFLADFSFSRSKRSELHNLREVIVRDAHAFLRQEIVYLQQAAYCVRLIEQVTETETPLPAIYNMLGGFVQALSYQSSGPQLVLAFELKLLSELGLQPDLSQTSLSAGAKALVRNFELADWAGILRLRLNPAQQKELEHFLQSFLLANLSHVPKGRDSALEHNTPVHTERPR
jgi:DNA repair protein RecO (recombination protein O)